MKYLFIQIILIIMVNNCFAHQIKELRTQNDINKLFLAINCYYSDYKHYPASDNSGTFFYKLGLITLGKGPYIEPSTFNLKGKDKDIYPLDEWGNVFIYKITEKGPELYSIGENAIDDNGKKDDITNWDRIPEGFYYKKWGLYGKILIIAGVIIGIFLLFVLKKLYLYRRICISGLIVSLAVFYGAKLNINDYDTLNNNIIFVRIYFLGLIFSIIFFIIISVNILKEFFSKKI